MRSRTLRAPVVNAGAGKLRLLVAALLAPVAWMACTPSEAVPQPFGALERLEQMAFVPAGRATLALSGLRRSSQVSLDEDMLVGMYEVTRGEFRAYLADASPALDSLGKTRFEAWSASEDSLPASFVTRAEAEDYAQWAGLRLLTSAEWLFCAMSPRALAYPWADSWQQGRANTLDLDLTPYAPTPVGTFEGGRTDTRLYDMLGNVWEWVKEDARVDDDGQRRTTVLGGSYLWYKQEIYREGKFFSQSLEPGARHDDVGFRVGAPARAWLEAHAGELERGTDARQRLEAVGRRWGPSAGPLLSDLALNARGAAARGALGALLAGARG